MAVVRYFLLLVVGCRLSNCRVLVVVEVSGCRVLLSVVVVGSWLSGVAVVGCCLFLVVGCCLLIVGCRSVLSLSVPSSVHTFIKIELKYNTKYAVMN